MSDVLRIEKSECSLSHNRQSTLFLTSVSLTKKPLHALITHHEQSLGMVQHPSSFVVNCLPRWSLVLSSTSFKNFYRSSLRTFAKNWAESLGIDMNSFSSVTSFTQFPHKIVSLPRWCVPFLYSEPFSLWREQNFEWQSSFRVHVCKDQCSESTEPSSDRNRS